MSERLEDLLAAVRRADNLAVARLVEQHAGSARRLAAALLNDAHEAEEAVQDAFVTALRDLEQLREPARFSGWFRQIVRTCCTRRLRRGSLRTGGDACEAADTAMGPLESASRGEATEAIRRAMAALTVPARATIELYYFDQRSVGDIALRLGLPEGTVKRRLHDARIRLRELLPDWGEGDDHVR